MVVPQDETSTTCIAASKSAVPDLPADRVSVLRPAPDRLRQAAHGIGRSLAVASRLSVAACVSEV
ncbi:hypothetical protein ATO13_08115 [Stappia sp. 22II-S9-Z10]|nr:hypothetical protein ATO13_08115 [Stappia sp. 22II-S9-Z10]